MGNTYWRKSSFSFSNGNCVEVAGNWRVPASCQTGERAEIGSTPGQVFVRDTQDRDGPLLTFPATAWTAFTARIRDFAGDPP